MAVKSTTKAAEAEKAAQVEQTTTETEKAQNGANMEATRQEEAVRVVYIGPTLPAGKLKSNRIFYGTMTEIKKELEAVLEEYPLIEKMLVPVADLAAKKDKVRTAGNILNKYYSDIVSAVAAAEVKEV